MMSTQITDHHERTRVGTEDQRVILHYYKGQGDGVYHSPLREAWIETINGRPVWVMGVTHAGLEQLTPWERVVHLELKPITARATTVSEVAAGVPQ